MEDIPLPFATQILSPITCTAVGYQPTGMRPFDSPPPGLLTSNTARQLLSALATYRVFSSPLSASALVVDPGREPGYSAAFSVSTTFRLRRSITDTLLSFALATKSQRPLRVRHMSLGLSPTPMPAPSNLRLRVSKISNLSQPQQVIYSSDPSFDSRQVYASPPRS